MRWTWVAVLSVACGGAGPEPKSAEPDEAPAAAPTAPAAGDVCVAKDSAGFDACAGKRVSFAGAISPNVMQHPITAGPSEPGGQAPEMNYVDVDGVGQVVVYTDADVACGGPVAVVGDLEKVDLGGEPGTKDSYEGWAVHGATITCQ